MRFSATVVALQIGCSAALLAPVAAREPSPIIPPELGVRSPAPRVAEPYYCEPSAFNFYHGTNYAEPPATYEGYTYRYYYRYSAYRKGPLTYVCSR
jgi:hypothetical protein